MSKQIRVSDGAYDRLQELSLVEGRSVVTIVDRLLEAAGPKGSSGQGAARAGGGGAKRAGGK